MPATIPIEYSHRKLINKQIKLVVVGLATIILTVLFLFLLAKAVWISPQDDLTDSELTVPVSAGIVLATTTDRTATSSTSKFYKSWPARLLVPSLNIDAKVQHVGISKSGRMAVPTNYTDVGWYRAGTIPGNLGSAVFDGHVDDGLGRAGVFKYLGNLQIGDEIHVVDQNGQTVVFEVESLDIYDYDEAPTDIIFKQADKARIRLITCQGKWVKGEETYSQRLVVTGVVK